MLVCSHILYRAAFYPECDSTTPHPFFPNGISQLTMFADYRVSHSWFQTAGANHLHQVPQILHHLNILSYPASLQSILRSQKYIAAGSVNELSIRAASILAVEAIRDCISQRNGEKVEGMSSVLIDFFLWDMAKRVESGEQVVNDDPSTGLCTQSILPPHRTRCTWY